MRQPVFKRKGLFYFPQNLIGRVIALSFLGYAIYLFIDIDRRSHSVSDTLINFVFGLLILGAIYSLIGFITNKTSKR